MKQTPAECCRDMRQGVQKITDGDEQRTFRSDERARNVRYVYTETDIEMTPDSDFSLAYLIILTFGLLY